MGGNEVTSLTLLERLRNADDSEAWTRFHDLYAPLIRWWLAARGLQTQDAEDVQQEVMRVAFAELSRFEHSGRTGALRCWLREAVSNQLRVFWRRRVNRPGGVGGSAHLMIAEQLADPHSELSRAWDEEFQRAVCRDLLATVSGEFEGQTMRAFRAVALEGKRPAEAAEELGMTANAIRTAQSRVLRRLREIAQGMLD